MDFKFVRQLKPTLWSAVVMELFERLAYYGMVVELGNYVVGHLNIPADKYGVMYGIFTATLCLPPTQPAKLPNRHNRLLPLLWSMKVNTRYRSG